MATRDEINKIVIFPMNSICRPPTDPISDPQGYAYTVEQWMETLADFAAEELRVGYQRFVLEWQWQSWPVPGYMRKHMIAARQELHPIKLAYYQGDEWSPGPEEKQRVEIGLGRLADWLAGKAPANTYSRDPEFSPEAQYDWIYPNGGGSEAHRADMVAKIREAGGA